MGVSLQQSVARASATPTPGTGRTGIHGAQNGVCTQVDVSGTDGDGGTGMTSIIVLLLLAGAGVTAATLVL